MPSFKGLYYPYIHFQDEGWLKTALLYWDNMARIVPDGTTPNDSFTVGVFAREGIVTNESPSGASFKIAEPFRQLLASQGTRLEKKFGISTMPENELSLIHDMKIDRDLRDDLEALNLAQCYGDWLGVHPVVARVYMTALAEEMAPAIIARPVVDNAIDHVSISGLTLEHLTELLLEPDDATGFRTLLRWFGRPSRSRATAMATTPLSDAEIEEAMVTLAFRCVVPANPTSIPIKQILKFRDDFKNERSHFQTEITKIVQQLDYLKDAKNPKDIAGHLQGEYDKRLAPGVKRLEEGMPDAKWDIVESAIAASYALPSGFVAAAAGLDILLSAGLGTAVGVAFAGWKLWRKKKKDEVTVLKPSAEAYLYRAKKTLLPATLAREIKGVGSSV